MSIKLKRNDYLAAFEAFAMYLLTGAACIVLGSGMSQLINHYNASLTEIAAFTSAFSLGRLVTVFGTGYLTERVGTKRVFAAGTVLIGAFLIGVPLTQNYYLGLFFCALGGIGMGAQDACCPVILNSVFPKNYASAMSAGQAVFCAGCFLAPMIMSLVLSKELSFSYTFYAVLILAAVMLAVLPFVKMPLVSSFAENEEHAANAVHLRSRIVGYTALIIACMAYCAAVNTISTFTTTFAESIGMSSAAGSSMLSAYNVGCMLGSIAFIGILRKVKESTVLWGNIAVSLITMSIAVLINSKEFYFVALFFTGCFMGVLFSVFVTLATGIKPEHASLAAALIAVACGLADTVAPLGVSAIVTAYGTMSVYYVTVGLLAVCLATGILFKTMIKTKHIYTEKESQ
ncbi:MAG: hypothetical protein CVU91_05435 [Firmicutes bacterium HGW-Firmicutes-16]|nr:MAG: hypothetical protein CVU91_05435 [Firmicutes bacterium HGW-Firmicutes-16]